MGIINQEKNNRESEVNLLKPALKEIDKKFVSIYGFALYSIIAKRVSNYLSSGKCSKKVFISLRKDIDDIGTEEIESNYKDLDEENFTVNSFINYVSNIGLGYTEIINKVDYYKPLNGYFYVNSDVKTGLFSSFKASVTFSDIILDICNEVIKLLKQNEKIDAKLMFKYTYNVTSQYEIISEKISDGIGERDGYIFEYYGNQMKSKFYVSKPRTVNFEVGLELDLSNV